jgi:hypothetical protein
MTHLDDAINELATVVEGLVETKRHAHVRTPAGVRKYDQPIGSIIVRDPPVARIRKRLAKLAAELKPSDQPDFMLPSKKPIKKAVAIKKPFKPPEKFDNVVFVLDQSPIVNGTKLNNIAVHFISPDHDYVEGTDKTGMWFAEALSINGQLTGGWNLSRAKLDDKGNYGDPEVVQTFADLQEALVAANQLGGAKKPFNAIQDTAPDVEAVSVPKDESLFTGVSFGSKISDTHFTYEVHGHKVDVIYDMDIWNANLSDDAEAANAHLGVGDTPLEAVQDWLELNAQSWGFPQPKKATAAPVKKMGSTFATGKTVYYYGHALNNIKQVTKTEKDIENPSTDELVKYKGANGKVFWYQKRGDGTQRVYFGSNPKTAPSKDYTIGYDKSLVMKEFDNLGAKKTVKKTATKATATLHEAIQASKKRKATKVPTVNTPVAWRDLGFKKGEHAPTGWKLLSKGRDDWAPERIRSHWQITDDSGAVLIVSTHMKYGGGGKIDHVAETSGGFVFGHGDTPREAILDFFAKKKERDARFAQRTANLVPPNRGSRGAQWVNGVCDVSNSTFGGYIPEVFDYDSATNIFQHGSDKNYSFLSDYGIELVNPEWSTHTTRTNKPEFAQRYLAELPEQYRNKQSIVDFMRMFNELRWYGADYDLQGSDFDPSKQPTDLEQYLTTRLDTILVDIHDAWMQDSKTELSLLLMERITKLFNTNPNTKHLQSVLADLDLNKKMMGKHSEVEWDEELANAYLDAAIRTIYNSTQEAFKKRGIETMRLARGMHVKPPEGQEEIWGAVRVVQQPLSSWTINARQSEDFAVDMGEKRAIILFSEIPVERIFAVSWWNGIGSEREEEVVVIGDDNDQSIVVAPGEWRHTG